MVKVVFDSSFLMAVVEKPTTWFEDMTLELGKVTPVALDCVVNELSRISAREGRRSKVARVALDLAGTFSRAECDRKSVDDSIVAYCRRNRAVAATVDREMIRALKRSRLGVVTLRQGRVAVA